MYTFLGLQKATLNNILLILGKINQHFFIFCLLFFAYFLPFSNTCLFAFCSKNHKNTQKTTFLIKQKQKNKNFLHKFFG